jgi:hypothetical protein
VRSVISTALLSLGWTSTLELSESVRIARPRRGLRKKTEAIDSTRARRHPVQADDRIERIATEAGDRPSNVEMNLIASSRLELEGVTCEPILTRGWSSSP